MNEWLNLELLDYKNKEDIWDLINLFDDISLQKYSELPPKCPFVFLVQKYKEVNGNKSHKPIGFIYLLLFSFFVITTFESSMKNIETTRATTSITEPASANEAL